MPDIRPEIHVGDIGTLYRVRIRDENGPFDPSAATVKQLIFRLPGGGVITKTATIQTDGSPATDWFLVYEVVASAGLGSPPSEFHASAGKLKVQAYLEWADGKKFKSDVRSIDEDGRELRVYANLS